MTHNYIKQPVQTEFSECGGASILLVNKRTVQLDTSIHEALEGNYVMDRKPLVRSNFFAIDSVSTGTADGVELTREDVHINCCVLPPQDELRISCTCGGVEHSHTFAFSAA